ncbi:hypothetical protein Q9R46_16190 [Paenibacillus sp. RRE4]|uniref:MAE-28990/MAE-18760-like HEPN domain-containing protein n=1 Tax=Paenibacillus silvae TaxID=1325358 RepID=A0ABQ1Z2H0_9BACL|nr:MULTISPECIES: hypothetical protein [Paenibacillus]MDT0124200.1 hypothetical protein [Paenibacillus sp. RRE4]GGH46492.1 hypothetical protein GCM10008014_09190 [Paenibacillus silvae]
MSLKINFSSLEHLKYALMKLDSYAKTTEGFISNADIVEIQTGTLLINGKEEREYIKPIIKNVEILNIFPHISRSSLFITICSTFEKCLYEIVGYISEQKNVTYNRNKNTHLSLLERFELFMKEEAGAVLPTGANRDRILDLNKIRNCIVHNDGNIWEEESKRAELISIISPDPTIEYSLMEVINEVLGEKNVHLSPIIKLTDADAQKFFLLKNFCFDVIDTYIKYIDEFFTLNK